MGGFFFFFFKCPRSCVIRHYSVKSRDEQMRPILACPFCSELMAAVWIDGFDNGIKKQQAQFCSSRLIFTSQQNAGAKQNRRLRREGGEEKDKTILTHQLQSIYGVQSSDSERPEQPLLTSFVQAGNINSS